MDSPYASVTPSSTHLGNFASNLSGGQIYAPGTPLGGAPAAANFNRQHFSPLSLLPPCSSASNGEFLVGHCCEIIVKAKRSCFSTSYRHRTNN